MNTHPSAKLGPAGRLALTDAIASGVTSAAEFASGVWLLDRSAVRTRARGCWTRPPGSGSATGAGGMAGDRGSWPAQPVTRIRRSGRFCTDADLEATYAAARGRQRLRVAVPGRPAAHGYRPLRAISAPERPFRAALNT
jgi:hypothetical protein